MARDGYNAAIQFTSDDAFCLDGQRLLQPPESNSNATPHCATGDVTENRSEEDHFVRILQGPSDDLGPQWFEADFKDGRIFCYGTTADSRLEGQRFHSRPATAAPLVGTPAPIANSEYAIDKNGHLIQWYWNTKGGGDWELYDITNSTVNGTAAPLVGSPAPIPSGTGGYLSVYAVDKNGHLLQFYWNAQGAGRWELYDITNSTVNGTAAPLVGSPAPIPSGTGGYLSVYAVDKNGHLLQFYWNAQGAGQWELYDITNSIVGNIQTDLSQTVRATWALAEVRDRFGNNLTVRYSIIGDPANSMGYEQLPSSIAYTGSLDNSLPAQRSVAFEYEPRPDTPTNFVAGLRLQSLHRLSKLSLVAPNPLKPSVIKTYNFKYSTSPATGRSLLSAITECDGSGVCFPGTNFAYSYSGPPSFLDVDTGIHDDYAGVSGSVGSQFGPLIVGDFNGDGCDDFIFGAYHFFGVDYILGESDYRLSSCYDAIASGTNVFPTPNPPYLDRLSPSLAGAPNSSTIAPVIFNPPATIDQCAGDGCIHHCPSTTGGGANLSCYNQLIALDLDLDARADLFSYIVSQDCGNPFLGICSFSNTWDIDYFTSIFLASSVPPAQWNPFASIFGAVTNIFVHTTLPNAFLNITEPSAFYYTSSYLGDINGDGFPDIVHFTPNGWSFQLNQGRAAQCSSYAACPNLTPESPFFPAASPPTSGLTNVFMTDVYKEGTTAFLLRDPQGINWYAAYRLTTKQNPRLNSQDCPPVTQYCPLTPVPNLALAAGDSYSPARRDWFFDVNGDGLPDSVSVPYGGDFPYVSINTGNGFDPPTQTPGGPLPSDNLVAFDYDGNGTQDIIYGNSGHLYALLTDDSGAQYRSVPLVDQNGNPIRVGSKESYLSGTGGVQVLDVNGDGLMDLVQILDGDLHVYLRQGKKPDLLETISDRGAVTSVTYAPLSSASVYSTTVPPGVISSMGLPDPSSAGHTYVLTRGLWVVSRYTVPRAGSLDSQSGPRNEYRYAYRDGRTDLLGRGWLGFGQVIETDLQTNAVVSTSYDNLTMFGSAYPSANKPNLNDKRVALTNDHVFSDRAITTTYNVNGTVDGTYTVVTPGVVHEQDFEAPAQLTVNLSVQPTWYAATFDLQIDGVTYASDVQSGMSTGAKLQPAGSHNVSEIAGTGNDLSQYAVTVSGDCDVNGNVTLVPGDSKTCTITNVLRESVVCSVFDDSVSLTNRAGPSGAIFISGRRNEEGMACVPSGQFGICRKAFGRCQTVQTGEPVYFYLFDDGYQNPVGPTDAVFIHDQNYQGRSGATEACLADGTCRKWFGPGQYNGSVWSNTLGDGRTVDCSVFDDGGSNPAGPSDAVFIPYPIPGPGEACIPSPTPTATCRRWFGFCTAHKK